MDFFFFVCERKGIRKCLQGKSEMHSGISKYLLKEQIMLFFHCSPQTFPVQLTPSNFSHCAYELFGIYVCRKSRCMAQGSGNQVPKCYSLQHLALCHLHPLWLFSQIPHSSWKMKAGKSVLIFSLRSLEREMRSLAQFYHP